MTPTESIRRRELLAKIETLEAERDRLREQLAGNPPDTTGMMERIQNLECQRTALQQCVAAVRLGRRFLATELNPDYIRIAEKRLAAEPIDPSNFPDDTGYDVTAGVPQSQAEIIACQKCGKATDQDRLDNVPLCEECMVSPNHH